MHWSMFWLARLWKGVRNSNSPENLVSLFSDEFLGSNRDRIAIFTRTFHEELEDVIFLIEPLFSRHTYCRCFFTYSHKFACIRDFALQSMEIHFAWSFCFTFWIKFGISASSRNHLLQSSAMNERISDLIACSKQGVSREMHGSISCASNLLFSGLPDSTTTHSQHSIWWCGRSLLLNAGPTDNSSNYCSNVSNLRDWIEVTDLLVFEVRWILTRAVFTSSVRNSNLCCPRLSM